jgi:hypothetical protein
VSSARERRLPASGIKVAPLSRPGPCEPTWRLWTSAGYSSAIGKVRPAALGGLQHQLPPKASSSNNPASARQLALRTIRADLVSANPCELPLTSHDMDHIARSGRPAHQNVQFVVASGCEFSNL